MHRFPIINGVPVLFPDGRLVDIEYDAPLTLRTGYDPWIHRNVLQSLTASNVVLDIGAGNNAPDLNPDEGIWQYLKRVELRNLSCENLDHLRCELRKAKERLRHKTDIIRACIRQPGYV